MNKRYCNRKHQRTFMFIIITVSLFCHKHTTLPALSLMDLIGCFIHRRSGRHTNSFNCTTTHFKSSADKPVCLIYEEIIKTCVQLSMKQLLTQTLTLQPL